MGEKWVGAYLKVIEKCDFISYNVRPPEEVSEVWKNLTWWD